MHSRIDQGRNSQKCSLSINQVERLSDLNEEAGNARRELYRSIFGDARVDTEKLFNGLTDIRDRHHTKIADAVQKAINLKLERYPKQIGG